MYWWPYLTRSLRIWWSMKVEDTLFLLYFTWSSFIWPTGPIVTPRTIRRTTHWAWSVDKSRRCGRQVFQPIGSATTTRPRDSNRWASVSPQDDARPPNPTVPSRHRRLETSIGRHLHCLTLPPTRPHSYWLYVSVRESTAAPSSVFATPSQWAEVKIIIDVTGCYRKKRKPHTISIRFYNRLIREKSFQIK